MTLLGFASTGATDMAELAGCLIGAIPGSIEPEADISRPLALVE